MERIHRELYIFFKVKAKKIKNIAEKNVTCDTPSNDSDHLCQI